MRSRSRIVAFFIAAVIATTGQFCVMSPQGAYLEVNRERCYGCAQCSAVCVDDAIRIIDQKAVIDPAKCVKCGKCVEVCPVNAVE
jgi:ferredoxin